MKTDTLIWDMICNKKAPQKGAFLFNWKKENYTTN